VIERPPLLPTFELPTHEELLALKVGDFAKLIFSAEGEYEGTYASERMWVIITSQDTDGKEWWGTLDNDPFDMPDYERGDNFPFNPLDIVGVM
jgi:hypothetical protein